MKKSHGLFLDPSTGKKSRLYHIWEDMKSRCQNPNNRRYNSYGGRGIVLCDDWKNDYVSFHTWSMENGYRSDLTIDRIDVNGNYCPENCRWATIKEQSNNRRTNRVLTLDGISKTMKQWGDEMGFGKHVIKNRLSRGWDLRKALTTPKQYK